MYDKELKEHLKNKINKLKITNDNLLIKIKEREWIEQSKYLNILNYWYYRYFTNDFILFIMKRK